MRPRLTRTVLFLSTLSLLVLPVGDKADATDTPGEISGIVSIGQVNTCHFPQPQTSHRRCVGGQFGGPFVILEATRLLPDQNVAVCSGPAAAIGFTTRETTAEGRGRIDDTHLVLTEDEPLNPQECRVRISGRFHRVGTIATGRLGIDVHRADGTFRHRYCAEFEITAVPVVFTGNTFAMATVEGIENSALNDCDVAAPPIDGRLPIDGDDPLHHDRLVLP